MMDQRGQLGKKGTSLVRDYSRRGRLFLDPWAIGERKVMSRVAQMDKL